MAPNYDWITRGLLDEYSVNNTVQNATWAKARLQFDLKQDMSFAGKEMVRAAYLNANIQASEIMAVIANTYAKTISARKGSFRRMYEQVGEEALVSVVRSYESRNMAQSANYRSAESGKWQRFAGGKLLAALSSPRMYRAASDGIEFINQPFLDSKARQWYRLQWGAGPGTGRNAVARRPGVSSTRMVFFGQDAGSLSIHGTPSPNFYVPRGTFTAGQFIPANFAAGREKLALRQKHASAPTFGALARPSRKSDGFWGGGMSRTGIAAQHYLESGVATIARLAPAGNEKLLRLLAAEAMEQGTGPLAKAAVEEGHLAAIRLMGEASKALSVATNKQHAQIRRVIEQGVISYGPRGQRFS